MVGVVEGQDGLCGGMEEDVVEGRGGDGCWTLKILVGSVVMWRRGWLAWYGLVMGGMVEGMVAWYGLLVAVGLMLVVVKGVVRGVMVGVVEW